MKLLPAVLALVLGACCAPRLELEDLPPDPGVYLELRKTDDDPDPPAEWEVDVRLYLKGSSLDTLVQVIHLEYVNTAGQRVPYATVVEAFKLEDGRDRPCRVDRHHSSMHDYRWMELYPARVEGANWSEDGFAMLTENELGTRTTTGAWFNAEHVAKHGVAGRVSFADRRNVTIWAIDATGEKTRVLIDPANRAK